MNHPQLTLQHLCIRAEIPHVTKPLLEVQTKGTSDSPTQHCFFQRAQRKHAEGKNLFSGRKRKPLLTFLFLSLISTATNSSSPGRMPTVMPCRLWAGWDSSRSLEFSSFKCHFLKILPKDSFQCPVFSHLPFIASSYRKISKVGLT